MGKMVFKFRKLKKIKMKLTFIMLITHLVFGCSSPEKTSNVEKNNKSEAVLNNDTLYTEDSLKNELVDKQVTITVSYAAIACGCPQWFETKYKDKKFLEGVERFYLEPADTILLNANRIWDGEHLPIILKVTGRFSKEKLLPQTYSDKDEPEKARIFWYDKISVLH